MRNKKKWLFTGALLIIALVIHLISDNGIRVETYYSNSFYPIVSACLKAMFGWLPFSIGDLLYGIAALILVFNFFRLIIKLFKRQFTRQLAVTVLLNGSITILLIYISFNLFWGINYNRQGITAQFNLKLEKYSVQELIILDSLLLLKVNSSKTALEATVYNDYTTSNLKEKTILAYRSTSNKYPFLHADPVSLKPSLWGWLGNYLGFTGYYNPFTGEAQVNTTVPGFIQPFVFCHETAHQLGYAKENEANFAGYIASVTSPDTAFHYSAYLDMFLYAQRNLYFSDSASTKRLAKQLSPGVKADLTTLKIFNDKHRNPFEPIVRWAYGKYLENNQQPSGVLSYDEVVGYLMAYYKKTGSI